MATPAQPGMQSPPQPGGQGQAPPGATGNGDPRQVIGEFRSLAQMIQALAQKYPEFAQAAAQMLPLIEKTMAQVAGNPNRVPNQAAPPNGA